MVPHAIVEGAQEVVRSTTRAGRHRRSHRPRREGCLAQSRLPGHPAPSGPQSTHQPSLTRHRVANSVPRGVSLGRVGVSRGGGVGCIYSVPAADLDVLVPSQSSERASLRSGKAAAFTTVSTARLPANLQLEIKPFADTPPAAPVGRSRPLGALPTPPANALVSPRTLINASHTS